MSEQIFTVGHSNHPAEHFVDLLERHAITAVADVRSTPYSRRNPQFNREKLRDALKARGMQYVFLGKELGARSEDESCYVDDKVSYALLAQTALFESGKRRLIEGARAHRIALMCAEKDPLDCHRTILVARALAAAGCTITHILADGSTETHDEALTRLMKRLKLHTDDMFGSRAPMAEQAYDAQAQRIAFDRKPKRRPG